MTSGLRYSLMCTASIRAAKSGLEKELEHPIAVGNLTSVPLFGSQHLGVNPRTEYTRHSDTILNIEKTCEA